MAKNFYEILNVPPTASQEEIKSAFKVLARKYHPDMNIGKEDTTIKMQEITKAYNVLSDINKRRDYDIKINNHSVSEKVYRSYNSSREDFEKDFDDWIDEYLRKMRMETPNVEHNNQWKIQQLKQLKSDFKQFVKVYKI